MHESKGKREKVTKSIESKTVVYSGAREDFIVTMPNVLQKSFFFLKSCQKSHLMRFISGAVSQLTVLTESYVVDGFNCQSCCCRQLSLTASNVVDSQLERSVMLDTV